MAAATSGDMSGLLAMNTCPPGLRMGSSNSAHSWKKVAQLGAVGWGVDGKSGQRLTLGTVEGGRESPDAASTVAQLGDLFGLVLAQSVGRVGDDGVDGVGFGLAHPGSAVVQMQGLIAESERRPDIGHGGEPGLFLCAMRGHGRTPT